MRRPEAYHRTLLDHEASVSDAEAVAIADTQPDAAADDGEAAIASIHGVVRVRESGLAARLQYDTHERRSGIVHLYAAGTNREAYAAAAAHELGDAHDGAYAVIAHGVDSILLRRDVTVPGDKLGAYQLQADNDHAVTITWPGIHDTDYQVMLYCDHRLRFEEHCSR